MQTEKEKLLEEIEGLREKLNKLEITEKLNEVKILQTSQQLDQLLNKYNTFVTKK